MDATDFHTPRDDAQIDFVLLFAILRRGWLTITVCALLAVAAVVLYLHNASYRYTASMVVTPAQSASIDGLGSRLGQLGGLASAVGVSLPDTNTSASFKLYIEGLKAYDTAQVLAGDPALMHHLFEREWDEKTRQWREPASSLRSLINAAKDILGIPNLPWAPPGAARLQGLLEDDLIVDVNPRSPVITMHFSHKDPKFAQLLLTRIDETVDSLMRHRALLRTNDYIDYLTGKLRTVQLAEQRLSITQTLGEQERVRMAASSTRPFVADVFSGPSATPRPTSPRPYLLLILSLLGGLALGVVVVLIRARRRSRAAAAAI